MKYGYFKIKTKPKKIKGIKVIAVFLIATAIFCTLTFRLKTGIVGEWFGTHLNLLIGRISFLIPVVMIVYGVHLMSKKINSTKVILVTIITVLLATLTNLLKLSYDLPLKNLIKLFDTKTIKGIPYGGKIVGYYTADFLDRLFGTVSAAIITGIVIIYLLLIIFEVSIAKLLNKVVKRIKEDIAEWQKARELIKKAKQTKVETIKQVPEIEMQELQPAPVALKQEFVKEPVIVKEEPTVKKVKFEEKPYKLPSIELLSTGEQLDSDYKHDELIQKAALLEQTLSNFNVFAKVTDISPGPVITRFELTPEPGIKIQQITTLSDDIALAMKTSSVRIIAPVPDKGTVGIEIPNPRGKLVAIRDILSSEEFSKSSSKLTIGLGETTDGKPYVTDLIPMPHILIAGATGSGKSVCIHTIINSILFKSKPNEVKFLLIDPKRLELPVYNGLPHLYDPSVAAEKTEVITDAKHAAKSLKNLVKVMEMRYEKFAKASVRNIEMFNELQEELNSPKEFYIVVIIDELADLMLMLSREIEDAIQRLAQMSRAVGIHLVLATQRPSVDVITGVIKANLSARIAFQVLSKTDSRVILDSIGAEDLLGSGDMLFLPTGAPKPLRLQGAFISQKEVEQVVSFIKKQGIKPYYNELYMTAAEEKVEEETVQSYLKRALELVLERKRVSQDLLKAHFGSSSRATDILSLLEIKGFIFKPKGTNKWHINFDKVEEYLKRNSKTTESTEE